jgi:hypothetical protein
VFRNLIEKDILAQIMSRGEDLWLGRSLDTNYIEADRISCQASTVKELVVTVPLKHFGAYDPGG